jgi:hypothetical protein
MDTFVVWWLLVFPSNSLLLSDPPQEAPPTVEVMRGEAECLKALDGAMHIRDAYCTKLGGQ